MSSFVVFIKTGQTIVLLPVRWHLTLFIFTSTCFVSALIPVVYRWPINRLVSAMHHMFEHSTRIQLCEIGWRVLSCNCLIA